MRSILNPIRPTSKRAAARGCFLGSRVLSIRCSCLSYAQSEGMLLRNYAASVMLICCQYHPRFAIWMKTICPVFCFIYIAWNKRFIPDSISFVTLFDSEIARALHFLKSALKGQYFSAGNEKAPPRQIARSESSSG